MDHGRCVLVRTWVLKIFFLVHGRGPGSELQVPPVAPPPLPWVLANEDLAIFTLVRLFSVT